MSYIVREIRKKKGTKVHGPYATYSLAESKKTRLMERHQDDGDREFYIERKVKGR